MTQRIFDVDNPQDVKDLFDILPKNITTVRKYNEYCTQYIDKNKCLYLSSILSINWHDKTEITRPVDESGWIGKLCWFWDGEINKKENFGILEYINENSRESYSKRYGADWKNCCPVKRDEIKFVEDGE